MTEDFKYVSKIGDVSLEFVGDRKKKIIMFEFMTYDPAHIKIFIITLRKAIEDFIHEGFLTIQQRVLQSDWHNFLRKDSRWSMLSEHKFSQTYIIGCDINNAIDCIANGIGVSLTETSYETIL